MDPRIGETALLSHVVNFESAATIASVSVDIYNAGRTKVVADAAGTVDSAGAATEHTVSYLWTPSVAGDYVYHLRYVVGTQTYGIRGEVTVLSVVSVFDRWIRRVYDWLRDSRVGEAQALLTERQIRENAIAAAGEYESIRPRDLYLDVALVAETFEYTLPNDWSNAFSSIERIEYPKDDTEQDRDALVLDWTEYAIDEPRGKWRLTATTPTTGETARVYYRTRHRLIDRAGTGTIAISATTKAGTGTGTRFLSELAPGDTITVGTQTFTIDAITTDTALTVTENASPALSTTAFTIEADTIPEADFDQVARYAAGLCLQQLANEKAGDAQPVIAAQMVNYRTKQQEYAAQAKAMMDAAKAAWGVGVTSAIGRIDYLPDHGAITYWGVSGGYF